MPAPMRRAARPFALVLACLVLGAAAGPAAAQEAMNRASALEVRKQFLADLDTVQGKFVALAAAIPDDKYAWRPAPGVRSVGEVLMHVASEFYIYTPLAYGARRSSVIPPGPDALQKFERNATKADVTKHLKESFEYTRASLAALDPASITGTQKLFGQDRTIAETTIIMTADLHEHLGQLIAYARMNGIKPPWSK
jgi:uncharacterized damage-inducible protein DinB